MCTALSTLLLRSAALHAQHAAPDAGALDDARAIEPAVPTPAPTLSAPEPLEIRVAPYPEPARAERIEASVLLRLSIDATGAVTEAEVIEPAGHGFDESAREALLQSRFSPGTRDGQAMAARVSYRYVFTLPPEPPPAPIIAPVTQVHAAAPPRPAAMPQEVHVRGQLTRKEPARAISGSRHGVRRQASAARILGVARCSLASSGRLDPTGGGLGSDERCRSTACRTTASPPSSTARL